MKKADIGNSLDKMTFLSPSDVSDISVREQISAPIFRVFCNIAHEWGANTPQALSLLGNGSIKESTYYKYKKTGAGVLSYDQIERISLILGIYKGLKLLFADDNNSLSWLRAKNEDFKNLSPLEYMVEGGIHNLYSIRQYIDSWRGVK